MNYRRGRRAGRSRRCSHGRRGVVHEQSGLARRGGDEMPKKEIVQVNPAAANPNLSAAAYNEESARYFPTNRRARTTVSAALTSPELLVEITVTACIPS